MRKVPLTADVDLRAIASGTAGFLGANLANLVNEASLIAARKSSDKVSMADLYAALIREGTRLAGGKYHGVTQLLLASDPLVTARAARYTAGQVLVARRLGLLAADCVIVVGAPLSSFMLVDLASPAATKAETEAIIVTAVAGRAAEATFGAPDQITRIGEDDLRHATALVERYVKSWGFGTSLPIRTLEVGTSQDTYPADLIRRIDREVSDFLSQTFERAVAILKDDPEGYALLVSALTQDRFLIAQTITVLLTEGLPHRSVPLTPPDSPV